MAFRTGDYVYPTDLPRRLLCRVTATETASTHTGTFQILTLQLLETPSTASCVPTELVRLDEDVLPAPARELWRTGGPAAIAS